jgi:hypothetical protein
MNRINANTHVILANAERELMTFSNHMIASASILGSIISTMHQLPIHPLTVFQALTPETLRTVETPDDIHQWIMENVTIGQSPMYLIYGRTLLTQVGILCENSYIGNQLYESGQPLHGVEEIIDSVQKAVEETGFEEPPHHPSSNILQ